MKYVTLICIVLLGFMSTYNGYRMIEAQKELIISKQERVKELAEHIETTIMLTECIKSKKQ